MKTYKSWNRTDYYNFKDEFLRIEEFNEYCKEWLLYFGIEVSIEQMGTYANNSVVDLNDFNRVKSNINILLNALKIDKQLNITNQMNQTFNDTKANELEERLKDYLNELGNWQFAYNTSGLTSTGGNNLRIVG